MRPSIAPAPLADDPGQDWRSRLDLLVRMLELAQQPSDLQRLYLSVALAVALELRNGPAPPGPPPPPPTPHGRVSDP
jgi:hypothetical protein